MCVGRIPRQAASPSSEPTIPGSTCFTASRLNRITCQSVEDDTFLEMPIIYAKVYPSTIVLMDTGYSGAARDLSVELTSFRRFLESVAVDDNGEAPLNSGREREYLVICTAFNDHARIGQTSSSSNGSNSPNLSILWDVFTILMLPP